MAKFHNAQQVSELLEGKKLRYYKKARIYNGGKSKWFVNVNGEWVSLSYYLNKNINGGLASYSYLLNRMKPRDRVKDNEYFEFVYKTKDILLPKKLVNAKPLFIFNKDKELLLYLRYGKIVEIINVMHTEDAIDYLFKRVKDAWYIVEYKLKNGGYRHKRNEDGTTTYNIPQEDLLEDLRKKCLNIIQKDWGLNLDLDKFLTFKK